MQNQNSFSEIKVLFKQFDFFSGLGLFRDPWVRLTWNDYIFSISIMFFVVNFTTLLLFTVIVSEYSLLSIILSTSAIFILILTSYNMVKCLAKKDEIHSLFDWCNHLYDFQKIYHPDIRDIAKTHIEANQKKTLKMLAFFRNFMMVDFVTIIFGATFVGLCLPEDIYPKFSPPVPYYYPFENQKTWTSFIVTVLGQFHVGFGVGIIGILNFGLLFCVMTHILTLLHVINLSVTMMKNEICTVGVQKNKEIRKFDEWIKNITNLICDASEMVSKVNKFFSFCFLLSEISSFGMLFIFGMILLVIHQQYFCAIGSLWIVGVLYFICIGNEKILDQMDNIKNALYDLPWYEMNVKQRKLLLLTMECDNIQHGLDAGQFHQLNNERFLIILRNAYSNCIVLKDLIKK